ncbi:MAG: hypothetical protein AAGF89_03175, partial [Bacteroidota bacterium]
ASLSGLKFSNALPDQLTAAPAGQLLQPFGYQAVETDNMAQELMDLEEQSERLLKARKAIRTAQGLGNFLRKLDSLAFQEFPVVLADTIGTVPVAIVFDKLQIHPEYAQLEVVLGMQLPQRTVSATQGQPKVDDEGTPIEYVDLYFGTPNLKFSHNGGIIGDITLGLYSNVPIGSQDPNKFGFVLKGWRSEVIPGSGGQTQDVGTYVKIDCDGFKEMGVEADVMFSREWIIPTNEDGLLYSSGRVRGSISTTVNDWNNIMVELNLPDFALASYPEFAFNLSNAVFDFSDYRNSSLVQFPPGYADAYLPPSNHNLWRGVYIQNLELLLPPQLAKANEQGGGGGTTTGGSTGMLMLDDYGEHSYTSVGLNIPDFAAEYGMRDAAGLPRSGPQSTEPNPLALTTSTAPAAAPIDTVVNRTRIGVNGLLVDGHGVSGHFYATNVINMGEGRMNDKWRFSVTSLEATLVASQVTGFGFGGNVTLPVAKEGQSFGYDAFVCIPDREYNFTVTIQQDYTFPLFKMADVTIEAGSYLDIVSTPTTFVPSAVLYGNAQINAATAAGGPSAAGDAVFSGAITFAGLKLSTAVPRMSFETGGSLGLSDVTLMGYTLPLADPRLVFTEAGPRLSVGIALNLMNQSDNGFSAGTDVSVLSSLDSTKTYDIYVNKGMNINSIYVRLKLPSINAFGYVHLFDDDPVFGNGFQGSLSVRIGPDTLSPIFAVEMNAIFGNVDYPYWYVDGMVESNAINVPLIPGVVSINGLGGGAYYHMKMDGYDGINGTDGSAGTTTSGVRYVPNQSITLGLKLSVPLTNWKPPGGGAASGPETLDGVATLELAFAGAALQDIMFYGKVEIVSPAVDKFAGGFADKWKDRLVKLPQDRPAVEADDRNATNNPSNSILGSLFLRMNFEYGFEFQGTARVKLNAANGKIVGTGGIDILISAPQSKWHLYVGGYTDNSIIASDNEVLEPINVTINLGEGITAGAGAYFLVGNDIPGPPPLHPAAAAYFGISSSTSHNRGSLGDRAAQGTGFAFGAYVFAYIEKRTRKRGKYKNNRIKAELGAGFDVSLLKYQRMTRCSKDTNQTPHGHKGWRATGRIWAYIDANVKYRGIGKNLGLGVLIQADIPNPTYLYMVIKVKVVFNFTVKFGIGDECGPPMNL